MPLHNPHYRHDRNRDPARVFTSEHHDRLPNVALQCLRESHCNQSHPVIVPAPDTPHHSTACSQCGGTTNEVPGRRYLQCAYCQSLVFPHGSPLTTDGITPAAGELAAECPCCSDSLQTGELDGHKTLYCRRCYGILVRNASFGDIVRNRRAARERQQFQQVRPIDTSQYERTLKCPSCNKRMETHPYYGPGNVIIDSCGDCGYVWLDHGELATLERAVGRPEPTPDSTLQSGEPIWYHRHVETPDDSPLDTLLSFIF